jgi:hypothetical protein
VLFSNANTDVHLLDKVYFPSATGQGLPNIHEVSFGESMALPADSPTHDITFLYEVFVSNSLSYSPRIGQTSEVVSVPHAGSDKKLHKTSWYYHYTHVFVRFRFQ